MRRHATQEIVGEHHEHGRRSGWPLMRARWALVGLIVGSVGTCLVTGWHRRHEETGGPIDATVRKVTGGIQDASTKVHDRLDEVRETTRNATLAAQVGARLGQHKSLDASRVEVDVQDEGTVILKGQVLDEESKEEAVELARKIRGVDQVEDRLAVTPPPRRIAADADDEPVPARPRRTRNR